jgi:DNA gyrase inhibitor GyrI
MNELDVKIVKLEPMRVASVYGFGASPELQARDKLIAWAGPKAMLDNPEEHRIFGFNNPNPSHGTPNYGYEFWITVGPEVEPDGEVRIEEFTGGLYAVTRCVGVDNITPTWNRLFRWLVDSRNNLAGHQWLEKHIGPFPASPEEMTLDLYAPIAE